MRTRITAEEETALHALIEQSFRLAARIRMVSAGQMTLAAVRNIPLSPEVKEAAGFIGGTEWMGAHDFAHLLTLEEDCDASVPGQQ